MDRKGLRREVLQARMSLSPAEVREKSRLITQKVLNMPEWLQAKTILFYADFRHEAATGELVLTALEQDKQVAFPCTIPAERRLIPFLIRNYPEDLQPGAWGILEPKSDLLTPIPPEDLDLVIVPGVVFDEAGNRLGYGGGYYDRFLPLLGKQAVTVALAFELQLRKELEPETHDVAVRFIVTEKRIIPDYD